MDLWTRRKFLIASGVVGASALAAGGAVIGWQDLAHGAATRPLGSGTPVLVLVTLYGGNDGLNTVVPAGDPVYQSARPDLAYSPGQVLDLGEGLGLNPALKGLHTLWQAGQLAIVRGVGYPQPSHSHFQSMDIWQTASPSTPTTTGWLGRWLDLQAPTSPTPASPDATTQGRDPLRAVSLGGTLPPLLAGATTSGSALPLGAFRLPTGRTLTSFTALGDPAADDPTTLAAAATADRDLLTVAHTFGPVLDGLARQKGADAGGEGTLAQQLDVVAACVAAKVPTRVYAVSLGGFDTHAGEKATQEQLLGAFDQAVSGFLAKVAHGANPVVLVAYSEFGRRVQANANEGTDHGTAAPLFVAGTVGGPVKGGFHGAQPSLTDLDAGDLRFTTDFRSVYATVLQRVLGADPHQVLGQDFAQLDFV